MSKEHKPIGELNGIWSFLLRVGLVFMPFFAGTALAFGVWVVQSITALEKADIGHEYKLSDHSRLLSETRFTPNDGAALRTEMLGIFRGLEDRFNWRNLELNPEQQRRKQP
jgi:hypothetical protein